MPQLDGLRAIAVLSVLWFHWVPVGQNVGRASLGEFGVDLFFVLSGFLITRILLNSRSDYTIEKRAVLRQFYIRRFLRIFPLFYGVLVIAVLIDIHPFRDAWAWHVTYLQNFYQWMHGRDMWGAHLWTLAVEEQFYLAWPMVVLFISRNRLVPAVISLIVLAPLFRFFCWSQGSSGDPILLPVSAMDCLGSGALIAILGNKLTQESMRKITQWLFAIGVLGFCISHLGNNYAWDASRQTSIALVCSFIVWRTSIGFKGIFGRTLQLAPISYIGRISYGVYVYHGFANAYWIWFFYSAPIPGYRIFDFLGWSYDLQERPVAVFIINVVVTFSMAILSWHFFEGPINRLKRFFPYESSSSRTTSHYKHIQA